MAAKDPDQPQRALDWANECRSYRAELKRQLKAGILAIDPLLRGDLPDWERFLEGMKLHDLLKAVPGIGPTTALDITQDAGFRNPFKVTVGDLNWEGRAKVADQVQEALGEDPTATHLARALGAPDGLED